ncbi:MAG: hypothetical protein AAFP04_10015 [Myxococcota bacterium]
MAADRRAGRPTDQPLFEEVRFRRERLLDGLNWYGLSDDFFMYVPPETLAGLRDDLATDVAELRGLFDRQSDLIDVRNDELLTLTGSARQGAALAAEIAQERVLQVQREVLSTLNQIETRQDQLAILDQQMNREQRQVERAMEPADCDFLCTLGAFVNAAIKIGRAIVSSVSAISDLYAFFDTISFDNIQLDNDDWLTANLGQFGWYASEVFEQVGNNKKTFNDVENAAKQVIEAGEAIGGADQAVNPAETAWKQLIFNTNQTYRELLVALGDVQENIADVEALDQDIVQDRNSAVASLRTIILECRLGLRTSGCDPIRHQNALHDRQAVVCEAGRVKSDLAVLFDYFYGRAVDFVSLRRNSSGNETRNDFRRNLMREDHAVAWNTLASNETLAQLVAELQPERRGTVTDIYCRPGEDCGLGYEMPLDREYQYAIMSPLLREGRTVFDIEDEVDAPNASLERADTHFRKRVLDFDMKLIMANGYHYGADN